MPHILITSPLDADTHRSPAPLTHPCACTHACVLLPLSLSFAE